MWKVAHRKLLCNAGCHVVRGVERACKGVLGLGERKRWGFVGWVGDVAGMWSLRRKRILAFRKVGMDCGVGVLRRGRER